ncbi:MAG: hypothetical protein H6R27_1967 [Proteobacteria bacterium]|nr:hypothetical protein [Pseudomonadota bacterium]
MSTIRFGRDERERDPLLARVAALPQSVEPSRDLWSGIRAQLEQPAPAAGTAHRGLSWSWALAAGVTIASVSVLFTWMAVKAPGDAPAQMAAVSPTPVEALQPVSYGSYARLGPEYVETRAEMLEMFRARLATLPDDVRLRVEQDLATIQKAADDIDAALATDPSSQLLNRLLLSTYQEELRLYTRVAAPQRPNHERT